MRSALLCVFFALIVHKEGRASTNEDFKPTPIPLDDWHGEKKDELAGTLQEVVATAAPPSAAAVPAHYWEDALRHSVYLTLVRDKIDQLIAKGSVISPDNKLEHASKEIDDHNLWERIKAAPFDRLSIEEPATMGDITIMSKGRLLEEKNGYRFTEDKSSKEKCNEEKCMDGVKAFWSVKRVRQRDAETIPGKYHYELTFSVNSQAPKKNKKPFDNPVRTFTVRESSPMEQLQNTQPPTHAPRPQRAVWVHKNITPNQHYQSRKNYQPQGLDRFFLSLFSDEEDEPPRKANPYVQQGYHVPQHSKAGYAGAPSTDQYHHKKPSQYPYKPTTYKYSRPPLGPPPSVAQAEHHYTDSDKLKIQFSPPKVQFRYPDSDGKPRNPQLPPQISPPQVSHQYNDPAKTKNPYPQIQPQFIDSDKTPNLYPQVEPQYNIDSSNQQVPFSQQVQHFLDEVKAKNPYPHPQTKYHYDVKSKVQPPNNNQQHYYREQDVKTNIQYPPQPDYRYQPSNVVKTTRPAILPTPPSEPLNITIGVTDKLNVSEITTKDPEIVTAFRPYLKPVYKPPPTKVSYFPEHIRPPVFNAPPGVFVTMDKKPFKPMPPLKYHHNHHPHMHSKPVKSRPVDFRPSPQVVDIQLFSDPDPLSDAFRPMAVNYSDNSTSSSETNEKDGTSKHKNVHHKNLHKSKPSKKHEPIKPQRTTTSTPDIITAQSESIEESDSMHWANNLLSAFVKTTPMASQETKNTTLTDTETTTTYEPTTTVTEPTSTEATTIEAKKEETTTATTTTPKQKKRTRPPPKFTKQEKLKKHKRVTTTTTTSTTTTTTEKPRSKRPTQDLTPQASSAATGTKSGWLPKSKIQNDTRITPDNLMTTTSTTTRPTTTYRSTIKVTTTTTTRPTTTTAKSTTTTPTPILETEIPAVTTHPKSINRFRISTLMQKGTSVNHDKWSLPATDSNNGNKTRQFNNKGSRRKGSNFQGYVSSTPKNIDEDHHNEEHIDIAYNAKEISSTTEMLLEVIPVTPEPTPVKSHDDESDYPSGTEETDTDDSDSDESDEESKDHSEYIFSTKTEPTVHSNEVIENQDIKRETVESTPHTIVKNKTKCKKKKHMNLTTTEDPDVYSDSVEVLEIVASTEKSTTEADIFAEIFGSYTVAGLSHDNQTKEPISEGSENQERFAQIDDDLEDFLDSLEGKKNDKYDNEKSYEQYDEEDSEESDYSPFNNEEESRSPKHADVNYEEYRDRPYSFLELMAME